MDAGERREHQGGSDQQAGRGQPQRRLKGEIVQRENIPAGVCVFAANHTSNADAPAIVGAIPRRIAILGRKSLFDIPVVGMAFRLALARPPTATEAAAAAALLDKVSPRFMGPDADLKALARLCHMLMCTNEFLYVN